MLKPLPDSSIYYPRPTLKSIIFYVLIGLAITWGSYANADSKRIVAIDGSLTEIIFALGEGDQLVGRDITSSYPAAALKLPSVGYMRSLSAEGILSLRPKLVIATKDAKPQRVLLHLKQIGVNVELIENKFTVEGVKHKIRQVAKILNREEKGEVLVKDLQASVDRATAKAKRAKQQHGKARAIFILNMRGGNMMVAGRNSRANTMLELAQITNPAAPHFKIFKPLTAEAAIQYNPQFIITITHGISSAGGRDAILNSPAISMTDAGRNQQLIVMGNNFLTFGPRLGEAIEELVNAVYGPKIIVASK